jgi:hypothetical protein
MANPEPEQTSAKDDDMHDVRDLDAPFPLGDYLRLCDPCAGRKTEQPCLRGDFDEADSRALDAQTEYVRVTNKAAGMGLFALLLALFQEFFGKSDDPFLRWVTFAVEVLYTGSVLVVVLRAVSSKKKEEWLSERFKAERLRLLKFKLLIDPRLWSRDGKGLPRTAGLLETMHHEIVNQPDEILPAFTKSDALPDLPRSPNCEAVDPSALERLLEYYRRKRLVPQRVYFEGKVRKKKGGTENEALSPIFFFTGIALALFYLILEFATHAVKSDLAEGIGRVLLFLSFAFPLGWAAIRTVRSAHELSRNRLRSSARQADLVKIENALNTETLAEKEKWDRTLIFGYLNMSEGVLAADQHEWVRLMINAEWYG